MSSHGNTSWTLLVSIVAAMGGLLFGFDIAIISGAVPFVQTYFRLDELKLTMALYMWKAVPETKGKTLEEIEQCWI